VHSTSIHAIVNDCSVTAYHDSEGAG
jgi:hypothetical protein